MATATLDRPTDTVVDERYERLALEAIVPSKTNPRTHFDDVYIAELAQSILDKGVVQPILVRPIDVFKSVLKHPEAAARNGAHFEIVAGECRFRASKLARTSHIPAIIRAYTDEQVLELQLIENIHRKDLSPLEQARGYRRLIDTNPTKHSAESIATRIGMSPQWVWDRMKLNDLIPDAKAILERDRMSVGHAILIARLKPEDQKRVVDPGKDHFGHSTEGLWRTEHGRDLLTAEDEKAEDKAFAKDKYWGLKACSVRELESWIHDHIRFDVAHMAKAVPLEFEHTAAKVEAAAAAPGRGKKLISITHEYRVADDARDDQERTYGSQSWERADGQFKSKTCEHAVLGVVVAGRGQGETFDVCVARDKCRVHFGQVIRQKEKAAKLRESGKGKQAAAREKKQQETWEERQRKEREERERWEKLRPHALAAAVAKIKPVALTSKVLQDVVDALVRGGRDATELKRLLPGAVTLKTFTRALAIIELLQYDYSRADFTKHVKKYGVDLVKLEKEKLQPAGEKAKAAAKAS